MIGDYYEVTVDMGPNRPPETFRITARRAGRTVRKLRNRTGFVIEERTRNGDVVRDATFQPERVISCVRYSADEPDDEPKRRRGAAGRQTDWLAGEASPPLEATG